MINHSSEVPGRSKGPSRSPSEYLLRPRSRSQNHVTLYEADAPFGIAARAAQHNHSAPAWGGRSTRQDELVLCPGPHLSRTPGIFSIWPFSLRSTIPSTVFPPAWHQPQAKPGRAPSSLAMSRPSQTGHLKRGSAVMCTPRDPLVCDSASESFSAVARSRIPVSFRRS